MENAREYRCPECGRLDVVVAVEQMFYVNTGGHYCYRTKSHDDHAQVDCLECGWTGFQKELDECCDEE